MQDPQKLQEKNERLIVELAAYKEAEKARKQKKSRFIKRLGSFGSWFFLGGDFKASIKKLVVEVRDKDKQLSNDTLGDVLAHGAWRFTRIGCFAVIMAFIPLLILTIQTTLLYYQNKKIDAQNIRLDQQTYLQEANRRSSLVFLFSNIMDAIDKELKDDYNSDKTRNLSPQLIGRIIALSTRLKPYKYLDGDTLISTPLSPERGQLLISLVGSRLDSLTYYSIFQKADLRSADLIEMDLMRSHLNEIQLNRADLRGANLRGADLKGAHLNRADLRGANLFGADLEGAHLKRANLKGATLREADLMGADLMGATLREADLMGADLSEGFYHREYSNRIYLNGTDADEINYDSTEYTSVGYGSSNLRGADLRRAFLVETNLEKVNLRDADLRRANLEKANLRGADLRGADLRRANLKETILSQSNLLGANLLGATVLSLNYLTRLRKQEVIGIESILKEYTIDSKPRKDVYGRKYYSIINKT